MFLRSIRTVIGKSKSRRLPDYYLPPNPKESDVYLVSFPKSGNTWLRYLLAHSIWSDLYDLDLKDMARLIPSFALEHDYNVMLDPEAPCNKLPNRIIKHHFAFDREAKKVVKKAIYICRDGRDAIVSYWHFCNQRDGTNIPFSDFIRSSSDDRRHFGPWRKHVMGWLNAPVDKVIVRYEDLLLDTGSEMRRILGFLGIDRSDDEIKSAIDKSSFESMKSIEKSKGLNLDQLKNVNFVRRGKVGGWASVFSDDDLNAFNEFHGGGVPELGYDW